MLFDEQEIQAWNLQHQIVQPRYSFWSYLDSWIWHDMYDASKGKASGKLALVRAPKQVSFSYRIVLICSEIRVHLLGLTRTWVMGGAPAIRGSTCSHCGQWNAKRGNLNLLTCWACGCRYCYLCSKHLRKGDGGTHFRPTGCKQHSAD